MLLLATLRNRTGDIQITGLQLTVPLQGEKLQAYKQIISQKSAKQLLGDNYQMLSLYSGFVPLRLTLYFHWVFSVLSASCLPGAELTTSHR